MKTFTTVLAVLVGTSTAAAHEMNMSRNKEGLFDLKPEDTNTTRDK